MKYEISVTTAAMIEYMRHLMPHDTAESDFAMPSLLKDVPSYTSTSTAPLRGERGIGELGRRPY